MASKRTNAHRLAKAEKRRAVVKEAVFGSGFLCTVSFAASGLFYIAGFLYWFAFGNFRMLPYGLPAALARCVLVGFALYVFSGKTKPPFYTYGELAAASVATGFIAFLVARFAEGLVKGKGWSDYQELCVLAACLMTANLAARIVRYLIQRKQPVPSLFSSGF